MHIVNQNFNETIVEFMSTLNYIIWTENYSNCVRAGTDRVGGDFQSLLLWEVCPIAIGHKMYASI